MVCVSVRRLLVTFGALVPVLTGMAAVSFAEVYNYHTYPHTYQRGVGYAPIAAGYGVGGYGGMTPAMGAGIGTGAAAAGVGQMNESNAEAQAIHQQAVSQFIQNRQAGLTARIEEGTERQQAEENWAANSTAEGKAKVAAYNQTMEQMASAQRLTAEQFDFSNNVLVWPYCLRGPEYTELRQKLDQLYDARTPADSGTNSSTYDGIQQICQQMLALVKSNVRNGMSVTDYITAEHFINSVQYEAQFQVKPPAR